MLKKGNSSSDSLERCESPSFYADIRYARMPQVAAVPPRAVVEEARNTAQKKIEQRALQQMQAMKCIPFAMLGRLIHSLLSLIVRPLYYLLYFFPKMDSTSA